MPDYMLTVVGRSGAKDVLVMDAQNIRAAIVLAEKTTGAPVSHGRQYHTGNDFDPALTIDARDGSYVQHHDRPATTSMQVVRPTGGPVLGSGR